MAGITLNKARTMIRKVMEAGKAGNMNPLAVIVLDAGGHVLAFERADGAPAGRFELAQAKAYGTIMMELGGTALQERAQTAPAFMNALGAVYGGKLLPVQGGVLIRDKRGNLIGAMGVTGDTSENDMNAALSAIEAVGFVGEG